MIFIEVLLVLLALVALYFGARFLASKTWIMGWIRGTIGLLFVSFTIMVIFVLMDFYSYRNLLEEQTLATLNIEELGKQHYKVSVEFIIEGKQEAYEIRGDLWQMDAKIIRWQGLFRTLGAKPGYRLDRISGRYYSYQEETRNERTVHELTPSSMGLDVWSWLNTRGSFMPWVDAVYGSATYLPLVDGGIYQVRLNANGLSALPVNSIAKDAVSGEW